MRFQGKELHIDLVGSTKVTVSRRNFSNSGSNSVVIDSRM